MSFNLLLIKCSSNVNGASNCTTYHWVVTDSEESHHLNVCWNWWRTCKLCVRVHTTHCVGHTMGSCRILMSRSAKHPFCALVRHFFKRTINWICISFTVWSCISRENPYKWDLLFLYATDSKSTCWAIVVRSRICSYSIINVHSWVISWCPIVTSSVWPFNI